MDKEKDFSKRKHPRLDKYDYSSSGAYFITICTQNRRCVLSRIVGRGLAPAESTEIEYTSWGKIAGIVGRGLAPAESTEIEYTSWGKIAEKQLQLLENRYPHLTIDKYVIMPNHIHAILILHGETAGASPRPTVMDIICAYKSLTAKECQKQGFHQKLFQTSFYEHIIRNREDYIETAKYIHENPLQWLYDELYSQDT